MLMSSVPQVWSTFDRKITLFKLIFVKEVKHDLGTVKINEILDLFGRRQLVHWTRWVRWGWTAP